MSLETLEGRAARRRGALPGPAEDRLRLGALLALFAAAFLALAALGGDGEPLPGAGAPNLTEMAGPPA